MDLGTRRLAAQQFGLVSRTQVHQLGGNNALITRRLKAGWWEPVRPGVFSVSPAAPEALDAWVRELWAGHLALGADSVVSHEAAAQLHGLRLGVSGLITLTIPRHQGRTPDGIVLHRRRDFDLADRVDLAGLPVTTIARTLVDLAMVMTPDRLVRPIQNALDRRLCSIEELDEVLERVRRRGRSGITRMTRTLATINAETTSSPTSSANSSQTSSQTSSLRSASPLAPVG